MTFLFTVSHECKAREIVKCEHNKFILCDMSAFEHEYSQVLFIEAIGCEIMHFLESLTGGGIHGNCSAMGHVGA